MWLGSLASQTMPSWLGAGISQRIFSVDLVRTSSRLRKRSIISILMLQQRARATSVGGVCAALATFNNALRDDESVLVRLTSAVAIVAIIYFGFLATGGMQDFLIRLVPWT